MVNGFSSRPPISGITMSVTRRWIGAPWAWLSSRVAAALLDDPVDGREPQARALFSGDAVTGVPYRHEP